MIFCLSLIAISLFKLAVKFGKMLTVVRPLNVIIKSCVYKTTCRNLSLTRVVCSRKSDELDVESLDAVDK